MAALRTARLLLRPWADSDVAAFAELAADPAVMRHLPALAAPGAAEAWVARARDHWRQHGFGQWVVEIPGMASFIGVVGLRRIAYEAHFTPAVEIAWRLARAHWSRGYAVEAAQAALDYGFGRLGLREIVAVTTPDNRRSRRVMERLGMRRNPADDFDHPEAPPGPLKRCILYRLRLGSRGVTVAPVRPRRGQGNNHRLVLKPPSAARPVAERHSPCGG